MARSKKQSNNAKRINFMTKVRVNRFRNKKKILAKALKNIETLSGETENLEDNNIFIPDGFESDEPLRDLLRSWVNCHGITTRAVNDLLKILKASGLRIFYHSDIVEIIFQKTKLKLAQV